MTTHTAEAPFRTSSSRGAGALAHPALSTAAAIIGCILVAVAIGLLLIALTSGGQAATQFHHIGHATAAGAAGTVSTRADQAVTAKVAAASTNTRPWRETLRGRAFGAGRAPASALLRPSVARQ